jgi:hypothetical protein
MLTPGAVILTQPPAFEKLAKLSDASLAPVVIAVATRAGEYEHASSALLPDAIAYVTPAAIELVTA